MALSPIIVAARELEKTPSTIAAPGASMTNESRDIDQQFLLNHGPAVVEEALLTGQKKKNLASVIRTMG